MFTCRVAKDKAADRKKNRQVAAQKVMTNIDVTEQIQCVGWNS